MRMRINGREEEMQKKAEDRRRGSRGLQRTATACNTALCRGWLSPNHARPGAFRREINSNIRSGAGSSMLVTGMQKALCRFCQLCPVPGGGVINRSCREHEQEQLFLGLGSSLVV
jgi:hypothetical protein